jgi:hypothetical protein
MLVGGTPPPPALLWRRFRCGGRLWRCDLELPMAAPTLQRTPDLAVIDVIAFAALALDREAGHALECTLGGMHRPSSRRDAILPT